jgi:hypothetical protein
MYRSSLMFAVGEKLVGAMRKGWREENGCWRLTGCWMSGVELFFCYGQVLGGLCCGCSLLLVDALVEFV